MKKIALTIAAFGLSAAAYADISTDSSDLYGWAVEDQRLLSVPQRNAPDVKSPFGNPDQYAGVLADEMPPQRDSQPAPGVGDSYGSILHSVGFSY